MALAFASRSPSAPGPATSSPLGKRHIEKYPEPVRRMADEGHEPAGHTRSHRIPARLGPAPQTVVA
ncbi:polysaccharide deacetylase family protein [Streptomyces sp. NPDC052701]|uniref:polysaccharide deacetylase family protein n=1 Tax=Streptomyces sp. NPDC052701 TaxID=3155533 RepID=UPI00342ED706